MNPIEFSVDKVKHYYSSSSGVAMQDIIIYFRELQPNPREPITVKPMADSDRYILSSYGLETYNIFLEGDANADAGVQWLDSNLYNPVKVDSSREDFGVDSAINLYLSGYGIGRFKLLFYGDRKTLEQAHTYVFDNPKYADYIVEFPSGIGRNRVLVDGSLDLSPYIMRAEKLLSVGTLSIATLREIMDEIGKEVASGKTLVQDTSESQSDTAKWLYVTTILENNLIPMNIDLFLNSCNELGVYYPMEILSFSERLLFAINLPSVVGLSGAQPHLNVLFFKAKLFLPEPVIVYDIADRQVIEYQEERHSLYRLIARDAGMQVVDFESLFRGAVVDSVSFQKGLSKLDCTATADEVVNVIFRDILDKTRGMEVYPSIRNSLLCVVDGRKMIMCYNDEITYSGIVQSEYFGKSVLQVEESMFSRFVDARFLVGLMKQRETGSSVQQTSKELSAVKSLFKPAIPVFKSMCANVITHNFDGYPIYDYLLRRTKRIMPIVTHMDLGGVKGATLFENISIEELLDDWVARGQITAFGSLYDYRDDSKLYVSIESFRNKKLLGGE